MKCTDTRISNNLNQNAIYPLLDINYNKYTSQTLFGNPSHLFGLSIFCLHFFNSNKCVNVEVLCYYDQINGLSNL